MTVPYVDDSEKHYIKLLMSHYSYGGAHLFRHIALSFSNIHTFLMREGQHESGRVNCVTHCSASCIGSGHHILLDTF